MDRGDRTIQLYTQLDQNEERPSTRTRRLVGGISPLRSLMVSSSKDHLGALNKMCLKRMRVTSTHLRSLALRLPQVMRFTGGNQIPQGHISSSSLPGKQGRSRNSNILRNAFQAHRHTSIRHSTQRQYKRSCHRTCPLFLWLLTFHYARKGLVRLVPYPAYLRCRPTPSLASCNGLQLVQASIEARTSAPSGRSLTRLRRARLLCNRAQVTGLDRLKPLSIALWTAYRHLLRHCTSA